MRILTFTTLFPNPAQPINGIFVQHRMSAVANTSDVTVVAPIPWGRGGEALAAHTTAGMDVYHPRFLSLPGRWPRLKPRLIAASSWPLVQRLHAQEPFDLIDAHFGHPDGVAAAALARRLGLPLVLSFRGSDIHRDLVDPRMRPTILRAIDYARAVIVVAHPMADALARAGVAESKVHVVENGVDPVHFSAPRADARREAGLAKSARLVLSVARQERVKGLDVLLDACARMTQAPELWLVGHGSQRAALEDQARRLGIADRVRFLGTVPHADLPPLYAAADAYALPSRNEGCPNVVLEAVASGCPVAATRVGEVPYLVQEGVGGITMAPEDPDALADALDELLTHPPDRNAVRATMCERTWASVAKRVLRVFERARTIWSTTAQ